MTWNPEWVKANAIPWMRANVRCETCRWWEPWCEAHSCRARGASYYAMCTVLHEGCATHWEPKEETR